MFDAEAMNETCNGIFQTGTEWYVKRAYHTVPGSQEIEFKTEYGQVSLWNW